MILLEYVNRVMAWQKSRDRGASAVEYALVLALVVGLLVLGLTVVGTNVHNRLTGACAQFGVTC